MVKLTEDEKSFLCLTCSLYLRKMLDVNTPGFVNPKILDFDEIMTIILKLTSPEEN